MKAREIFDFIKGRNESVEYSGNLETEIIGFSSLYNYKTNTLTWARHIETLDQVDTDLFHCMITAINAPTNDKVICQLKVNDPRAVFFAVVDFFWGVKTPASISSFACVEEGAVIGKNVSIGPYTYVSSQTVIGDDCTIGANVVLKGKIHIGDRCVIQSGAVIGEDGFAYTKEPGKLVFVKHYGGVWIGDDVAIGANTCIARGTIDDTLIKNMAKIDNLCHIAHNTVIGERAEIIASTTVMGSVHIGDDSWIATSMIRDQRHVGDRCVVGMGSVVVKDVPDDVTVAGNPARPFERKETI